MWRYAYRGVSTPSRAASTLILLMGCATDTAAQLVMDATEEARLLVAMVTCRAGGETRIGAGIVVGADAAGLVIATSDRIVRDCRQPGAGTTARVRLRARPDTELPATVLAQVDTAIGLAVLRVARDAASFVDATTLPFDRIAIDDSVALRDDAVAITYQGGRPWHTNYARDLRAEAGDFRIRYEPSRIIPGRLVRDTIAPGHAGAALVTIDDRLIIGMVLNDQEDPSRSLSGAALRIGVLRQRLGTWRLPVSQAPVVPDTFSALAVASAHMCGLAAGTAYCWGENDDGQLGIGVPAARPSRVLGRLVVRELHATNSATCALTTAGAIYCWGRNGPGIPEDSPDTASVPRQVSGNLRFRSMSLGGAHACALTSEGHAYCWGSNDHGQLGDGSIQSSMVPLAVAGSRRFRTIAAGGTHSCALADDGAAYCWGDNRFGAAGNGLLEPALTPVRVAGGLTFRTLTSGESHTCGLTSAGAAYCWGMNEDYRLGDGGASKHVRTPAAVAGGLTFASVAAGDEHTCGITTVGVTYCWGSNGSGQLGGGDEGFSGVPVRVATDEQFAALSLGRGKAGRLTCGLTRAGAAYCWGRPAEAAQVGTAYPANGSRIPVRIRTMPRR